MYKMSNQTKRVLLFVFFMVCLINGSGFAQTTKVAELQQKLRLPMADSSRLKLLYKLTAAYSSVDMEKKLYYAKYYKKMAERLKVDTLVAEALIDIGGYYAIRSKMDSALYYFSKGYDNAKQASYEMGEARSLASMGFVYSKLDNYKEAVNNYRSALKIYNKKQNSKGISQCYINIGSIYFDSAQYSLAESYFMDALKSYRKVGDTVGIGAATFSLGNANRRLRHFEKAKDYYSKSLQIREKLGDLNGIALARWGLGILDIEKGNYAEAIDNLNIALRHDIDLKNTYHETAVLVSLADAYLGMKNYQKAQHYADRALANGYAMKSKNSRVNTYKVLIKIAKAQNNIPKAFKYQSDFIAVSDSIETDKVVKETMLAEFDRVRSENSGLVRNNQKIKSKNTDYLKTIAVTSFLLVLVIALLLTYYYRNLEKNETNKLLQKQKEEIASVNSELEILNKEITAQMVVTEAQNQELAKLNAVKNKFFSIVSHDLRSPIANLQMLFGLYRDGQLDDKELSELLANLEETIYSTGAFLDNLLEWSKSQLDGMVVRPVNFNINRLIEENVKLMDTQLAFKQIKVVRDTTAEVKVYADPNMINVVVRNLLSNSVKFCKPGDSITFILEQSSHKVKMIISDTGPGISSSDLDQLFHLEHTISKGSNGEKGYHIGLILCKDMVEQNQGNIFVSSEPGKGTCFTVELPKGH